MAKLEDDLSGCSALVIDADATSRSILIAQLRDFGVGTVMQAARTVDARSHLEYRTFDFVLCEQSFPTEAVTGQDLLDDLQRNQLLPFSTIFIMITAEATYATVAEAAESALDSYLLKPHKATQLAERLYQARMRKLSLQQIFSAIESKDFQTAAQLCIQRFETKGLFWLYAARVGAELLMRIGKFTEAQKLYKAVVAVKKLPWAVLGVARAQLDAGLMTQATNTLESLVSAAPTFADAYDVMARAYFEMGRFGEALEVYKQACLLTPASISRLQNLAMITYFNGDHGEAEKLLDRTVRVGLESKMFDCQTLVLLAFTHLENGDQEGLQRCHDDFLRLIDRDSSNARQRRLANIVVVLNLIQQHQLAQSLDAVQALIKTVLLPEFDVESASNLLALMSQLANKAIPLDEAQSVVETLGMRFCSNRSLTELLAASAIAHPPYAESMREAQAKVLKFAEMAMSMSMAGESAAAVKSLLLHGKATLNSRLVDNAYQLLQKHSIRTPESAELTQQIQELRAQCGTSNVKASLGEQKRQAGGLALRSGTPKASKDKPVH